MREIIINKVKHSFMGPVFYKLKNYNKKPRTMLPLEQRIAINMDTYEKSMGYRFDLNMPKTFTEKKQWYKMYYSEDLWMLVDKVAFKQYIKEKIGDGYTIPLYGAWNTVDGLKEAWASLPEEFVLKSNASDNGRNIIFVHNKSKTRFSDIKRDVYTWLNPMQTLNDSNCIAYKKVIPQILAEEYKSNFKNQLYDYKFFCFNGKPYCMYVAIEHFDKTDDYPITFYDLNWKRMDVSYGSHGTTDIPRPIHFDEMKILAEKLSEGFPFLRVDFFDTEEKLYLAELTLYPGGGFTPYRPESFNEELGKLFNVPM